MQTTGGALEIKYLKGTNGSLFPETICRRCGMYGHYQSRCPIAINDQGTRMRSSQTVDEPSSDNVTGNWEVEINQTTSGEGTNTQVGTQEVRINNGIGLNQSHINAYINPDWILLDSESSQHIFKSEKLLTDVETITDGESLRLYTNGGYIDTYKKESLESF